MAATARLSEGAPPGAVAWAVADNADPATPGQLIAAARDRFGRLAASVRAPLPGLAISNGLFPGLAGVVKTLADEHGPAGIRINGRGAIRSF